MNIEELFNLVIQSTIKAKKKKVHGQKYWQPIKKILETSNYNFKRWKSINDKYYKNTMSIPEKEIDGYGKETMIEVNHFLIQTIRIPKTEKPTLRKLIQLALNIGQYKEATKKNPKYYKIEQFVTKKVMKMKVEDVLEKKEITKLIRYLKK